MSVETVPEWTSPPLLTLRRMGLALGLLLVLIISWRAAGIQPAALLEPAALSAVGQFVRSLFPPDLSASFLRVVVAATGQTIATAIAGTILSIILGLPLGVLATATLWREGVLLAGERRSLAGWLFALMSRAMRALLGFLRAVPDLIWGLLFVVAVGLGSLAGALALAVSYCGMLGRVYADLFEAVDPRPLEALHTTGARRLQVFLYAIWPQAKPNFIAYTLYSFECCMRAAAVLGFIGAGGLGYEINISMRLFEYGQVLTLILVFIALIGVTERVSRFLRRRLQTNALGRRPGSETFAEGIALLRRFRPTEKMKTGGLVILFTGLIGGSFYASGFLNGALGDTGMWARMSRFVWAMLPPDLDPTFLTTLGEPLLQTIGISVIGTLIGIGIGAGLVFPATSVLVLPEADLPGKTSLLWRGGRELIRLAARLILSGLRSIPELVWALICILAVGLGPFAGTLAIGLHTGGVLGKLYAETLEEVPGRPLEALRAAGARPMQIFFWGIWPQARAMLASYTVLRWEMNLRVSTILGLVGGGGLGQAIYNNIQLGFYPRVTTLIMLVYALVVTADWVSDRLRANQAAT